MSPNEPAAAPRVRGTRQTDASLSELAYTAVKDDIICADFGCLPPILSGVLLTLGANLGDPAIGLGLFPSRTQFKGAFAEAMATLTTRERNILRHQVLDGLTLDQIGAIYNKWFRRFAKNPPVMLKALYQLNATPE